MQANVVAETVRLSQYSTNLWVKMAGPVSMTWWTLNENDYNEKFQLKIIVHLSLNMQIFI